MLLCFAHIRLNIVVRLRSCWTCGSMSEFLADSSKAMALQARAEWKPSASTIADCSFCIMAPEGSERKLDIYIYIYLYKVFGKDTDIES